MKTLSRFVFCAATLLMLAGCKEENVARGVTAVGEEPVELARVELAKAEEAKAQASEELNAVRNQRQKVMDEIDQSVAYSRALTRDIAVLEASKLEYEKSLANLDSAKQSLDRDVKKLKERWGKEAEVLGDSCFDKPLNETFSDMANLVDKTFQENKELQEKLKKLDGK